LAQSGDAKSDYPHKNHASIRLIIFVMAFAVHAEACKRKLQQPRPRSQASTTEKLSVEPLKTAVGPHPNCRTGSSRPAMRADYSTNSLPQRTEGLRPLSRRKAGLVPRRSIPYGSHRKNNRRPTRPFPPERFPHRTPWSLIAWWGSRCPDSMATCTADLEHAKNQLELSYGARDDTFFLCIKRREPGTLGLRMEVPHCRRVKFQDERELHGGVICLRDPPLSCNRLFRHIRYSPSRSRDPHVTLVGV